MVAGLCAGSLGGLDSEFFGIWLAMAGAVGEKSFWKKGLGILGMGKKLTRFEGSL